MSSTRYTPKAKSVQALKDFLNRSTLNYESEKKQSKKCIKCGEVKPINDFKLVRASLSRGLKSCLSCREKPESLLYDFYEKGFVSASKMYAEYNNEYNDLALEFSDLYDLDISTSKYLLKSQVCAPTMERYREWRKKKVRNDDVFKLRSNLSSRIITDIKKYANGQKKSKSTLKILGKDVSEFIDYLGGYKETMELDHIIPVSWANTVKEVEALNHYSNFQWLTPFDNLSKRNRFSRAKNVERVLQLHNEPSTVKAILERNQEKII